MAISYRHAHKRLRQVRGYPNEHVCPCGQPATEWAYQFTAGDAELRLPDGSHPYSTNPDDYAPMCRTCHFAFDNEHDPEMMERKRAGNRKGGMATAKRRQTDSELDERMRKAQQRSGLVLAKKRRRCSECGFVSNPSGIQSHQRSSGHNGYEEIETRDE